MVTLKVHAPFDLAVCELMSIGNRLLEEGDTFGIFHLTEVSVEDFVEFVENAFVDPLVEEIHLIWAVIKDVFDAVLDAGFDAFHIVIEISESKLWFNHPEFAGVTGGV